MWALLMSTAMAQTPLALEANLNLALPHAQLGVAPGLRVLFEGEITDSIWLGGEASARIPGATTVDVNGPDLADAVELRSAQTALALGGRFDWVPGEPEDVRPRLGAALGATRLIQASTTDAGTTREGAASIWLKPEGGVLIPLGPGDLAVNAYWSIAPTQLDTLGGGGSVIGIGVGWRQPLN